LLALAAQPQLLQDRAVTMTLHLLSMLLLSTDRMKTLS
jgi:hypothetical protein